MTILFPSSDSLPQAAAFLCSKIQCCFAEHAPGTLTARFLAGFSPVAASATLLPLAGAGPLAGDSLSLISPLNRDIKCLISLDIENNLN